MSKSVDPGTATLIAAVIGAAATVGGVVVGRWSQPTLLRPPIRDMIIFVTGASSAGKTALAHELARRTGIRCVIPLDMLRRSLRGVPEVAAEHPELAQTSFLAHETLQQKLGRPVSVREGIQLQSTVVWPTLREAMDKARDKDLGAIFEGSNILPSLVFGDGGASGQAGSRLALISLHIGSDATHLERLRSRQQQGAYGLTPLEFDNKYIDNLALIRKANQMYYEEAREIQKEFPGANIFVVDNERKLRATAAEIARRVRQCAR
ncbi:hypothetical protein ACFLSZ_01820 [Candidatus Bipolaricaulota bacterium]